MNRPSNEGLLAEVVDPNRDEVRSGAEPVRLPLPGMDLPHVHNDQPLSRALARMRDNGHKVLPVVSRANARIMLGVVTFADIMKAYGVESADELDYRDHPDL